MKFYSIRDAIIYRHNCPVCHSKLSFDGTLSSVNTYYALDGTSITKITCESHNEDVILDIDSRDVKIEYKYFEIVTGGDHASTDKSSVGINYDGHLYEKFGMVCDECCQYEYLIKFIIDLRDKKIIDIELNSEVITVEDYNRTVHEIKNIYATGETQYTYFPKTSNAIDLYGHRYGEKIITIPLIPLDIDNPTKTLDRIKMLILFS